MKNWPSDIAYGVPSQEFIDRACEEGLHENHEFQWLGDATIDDVFRVYRSESEALAALSGSATEARRRLEQSEELRLDWPTDEELWNRLFPFHFADIGVASTTAALALHGGVPITSCVGTARHPESLALVLFWANESTVALVSDVAQEIDVDLDCPNSGTDAPAGLAQFAVSSGGGPKRMRELAIGLAARHAQVHHPERMAELTQIRSQFASFDIPEWFL